MTDNTPKNDSLAGSPNSQTPATFDKKANQIQINFNPTTIENPKRPFTCDLSAGGHTYSITIRRVE